MFILYSKAGAQDYKKRIESYLKMFEDNDISSSDTVQPLQKLDGKKLKYTETLNFDKELRK